MKVEVLKSLETPGNYVVLLPGNRRLYISQHGALLTNAPTLSGAKWSKAFKDAVFHGIYEAQNVSVADVPKEVRIPVG